MSSLVWGFGIGISVGDNLEGWKWRVYITGMVVEGDVPLGSRNGSWHWSDRKRRQVSMVGVVDESESEKEKRGEGRREGDSRIRTVNASGLSSTQIRATDGRRVIEAPGINPARSKQGASRKGQRFRRPHLMQHHPNS